MQTSVQFVRRVFQSHLVIRYVGAVPRMVVGAKPAAQNMVTAGTLLAGKYRATHKI